MLTVTVNNPNYAPGTVLEISSLGAFNNGEATEVTAQQEENYFNTHGRTVEDLVKEGGIVSVSGTAEFTPPPPEVEAPQFGAGGGSSVSTPVVSLEEQGPPNYTEGSENS